MLIETRLPVPQNGYDLIRLNGPDGEWTIAPAGGPAKREVSEFKFRAALPDGETFSSIMEEQRALKDEENSREYDRLRSYTWAQDIGYTQSVDESRTLIEMLCRGNQPEDDVRTILERAGFRFKYDLTKCSMFEHAQKPAIEVMLSDEYIHYVYSTGPRWYNLLRLTVDHWNHDMTHRICRFWPEACRDPLAIGAQFIVDNVERRLARKGKRFYTRLEPCNGS